jgi:spore germination protein YaaH
MRDKYIELIREYVKQKPGYEFTLEDIKKDVLSIGATDAEFDEAIRQITSVNTQVVEQVINGPQTQMPKPKKKISDYLNLALQKSLIFARFGNGILHTKKKYVAAIAFVIVLIIMFPKLFENTVNKPQNATVAQLAPVINLPTVAKTAIPVVYANSKPIDVSKIFSVKSNNIALTVTGKPKKEVLGFFPYWILADQDKVNLQTLTSVSLFGLDVDQNGNITALNSDNSINSGWGMWKDPNLDKFIKRAKAQDVKIYLTLKSFDDSVIENISKSDSAQKALIANAIYLVNSRNLDGINIDFEYLGGSSDTLRDGFARFITNLNTELKRQLPGSVLTIDTYLVSGAEKGLFNLPILAQNSDAFVIMGYDMHTPAGSPGPVSAMGGDTNIVGYVQNYLEQVDANKLILAVPYYGYDWPLNVASPSADMVKILPYAEIADQSKNLQLSWDDTSQTPYFNYTDDTGAQRIVHFDNVRSLGVKYDFINRKNLRGVGLWALGYDGENQDLQKLLIDKFINQ